MFNTQEDFTAQDASIAYEYAMRTLLANEVEMDEWLDITKFGSGAINGLVSNDVFDMGYEATGKRSLDIGFVLAITLLTKKVVQLEKEIQELKNK
jgi:hypothetical protein